MKHHIFNIQKDDTSSVFFVWSVSVTSFSVLQNNFFPRYERSIFRTRNGLTLRDIISLWRHFLSIKRLPCGRVRMIQMEVKGAKNSFRDPGTPPIQSLTKITSWGRRIEEPRVLDFRKSGSVLEEDGSDRDRANWASWTVEGRRGPQWGNSS